MVLRLGSFKTRTALANALAVAALLVANSVYLLLADRAEVEGTREAITAHAAIFARAVGRAYARSGASPALDEVLANYWSLEPALERLQILSPRGDVLFNWTRSGAAVAPERPALLGDPERLGALMTALKSNSPVKLDEVDGQEILAPYQSESGEMRFVVSYDVSFKSLAPVIQRRFLTTLWLTLVSVLAALLVAALLASRITRPIQELTRGAIEIGEGNFERRLNVGGDDEIRILADTFNQMAARLKQNVEELERSNRRLASLNEELKELDRMKSDLLANVSHELRTPLTAIKGYTDYILDGKLGMIGEKQEKGLIVIQRNLERLSRSINALLDFSTMDVGRIALNLQPFALPLLVEQIHQTLRSELERKQLRFEAQVQPGLPSVIADRERLGQVLENLVINAIKFTPAGGRIRVAAEREDGRAQSPVVVSVSDTGIGIPEDQIGKIFSRFHQVDGTTTRRFGGVGLGLAIVRSILDAHGAGIKVESREGQGTTFHFWLPVIERDESQLPSHPRYP